MTQWFCRDKILGMFASLTDAWLVSIRLCLLNPSRWAYGTTERNSYPTDLTSEQWDILQPLMPPAKPGGRPRKTNIREVINAIFYLLRSGCAWRLLPHDFPPGKQSIPTLRGVMRRKPSAESGKKMGHGKRYMMLCTKRDVS